MVEAIESQMDLRFPYAQRMEILRLAAPLIVFIWRLNEVIGMTGGYSLRWFEEDDLEAYLFGLNRYIYEDYDEEWFRWKFLDNPNNPGFTSIAVVVDPSGEPVAFNGFLPLKVRIGEEIFMTVQGCDGFVSQEHRRRGLFQMTIEFMSRELRDFDLLIGFNYPESASAAMKAGCFSWGSVSRWLFKPAEVWRRCSEGELTLTPCGIGELEKIYERWASSSRYFHISRDRDYLSWRFERNPRIFHQLRKVELDGSPVGYISYFIEKVMGSKVVKVDDYILLLPDQEILPGCILSLAREHEAEGVLGLTLEGERHLRWAETMHPKLETVYTMIMRGIRDPELGVHRRLIDGADVTHPDSWHLTKSDAFEIG
jgi:hypothetical protein